MLAGSGQCNVTHTGDVEDFVKAYHEAGGFMKPALAAFPNTALMDFLQQRKVPLTIRADGKVFPASLRAGDVLNALLTKNRQKGVVIKYNAAVRSVTKTDDGFAVQTSGSVYKAKSVVVATGGMSYPKTGSTGDGLKIAEAFGHSLSSLRPALAPLYAAGFADIAGISIDNGECELPAAGKRAAGSLLFTHKGLSGPAALHISRYVNAGDMITVNLLGIKPEEFTAAFKQAAANAGKKQARSVIRTMGLAERLTDKVFAAADISLNLQAAQTSKEQLAALCRHTLAFPVHVQGVGGWDTAMASCGGVSLNEINPKTMESKLVRGLFFAGEVLDVDGISGGYNIQAAFSTGFLAARCVASA